MLEPNDRLYLHQSATVAVFGDAVLLNPNVSLFPLETQSETRVIKAVGRGVVSGMWWKKKKGVIIERVNKEN